MMLTNQPEKKIIWSISGSDCSGGAGIAADIKTAHGLGVEICTLITANTVQNSKKLISVNPVAIELLQQQFECLQNDKPPQAIKIGLIANVEQANWLCQILPLLKQQQPQLIVVLDPVGQASVGGALSALTIEQLQPLLALVDVITPNLIEAEKLAAVHHNKVKNKITEQRPEQNLITVNLLAKAIRALGAKAVIVKGGHSDQPEVCRDYCLSQNQSRSQSQNQNKDQDQDQSYQLSSPRIKTHANHGGGCSFATALASFMVQGYLLRDAFTLSKAFLTQGMAFSASAYGNSTNYGAFEQLGWPTNKAFFPTVVENQQVINNTKEGVNKPPAFASLNLTVGTENSTSALGLYPVVDSIEWLKILLPLNLEIIQLRVKNLTPPELDHTIKTAVELSQQYSTRLFINDYWQLAIKHGAYGVHVGQEDLEFTDLNAIKAAGLRLGISTHGCYEFLLAQQLQPSYLAIGAIFPTKTKDMTGQIQGVDNLYKTLQLANNIPVVAIGGITHNNANEVLQTGVNSIAVVTAITESDDPILSVNKFLALIKN